MSQNYLCDVADATRYIQGKGYDANSTPNLEENIKTFRAAAHKKICNYVGYEILSTVYSDELYFGSGSHFLYLFNRPITTLTTIKQDDSSLSTSNFSIFQNRAIYYEDGFFSKGSDWKISYTAGWTRTTMPGDVRLAVLELIYLYAQEAGPKGSLGMASFSQPEGSGATYDPETEARILTKLDAYRSVFL